MLWKYRVMFLSKFCEMNKKVIAIVHAIVMFFAYISPFWLEWRLILVFVILYYLQLKIFGGCILTYAQYGRWDETFSGRGIIWFLSKFGLSLGAKKIKFFLQILPIIILLAALLYQQTIGLNVIIRLSLI